MAVARHARVIATEASGEDGRLLTCEMLDGPLRFTGGQYVIVDTGLPVPGAGGKVVKRCYSLLSSERDARRFQLAVRRVDGGLGSPHMLGLGTGAELSFSGPWGKLPPEQPVAGVTWVLATDTGITAALGLLNGARLGAAALTWYVESGDYLLSDACVRGRAGAAPYRRVRGLVAGHPERGAHAVAALREQLAAPLPATACLVGDGDVLYPVRDRLIAAGMSPERIRIECFFHKPPKELAS